MPTLVEIMSVVAAVVATVTGVRVLRRRRTSPLALPLAVMLFAASEWATARALLHVAAPSVPATVALHYAVFPGAAVVVGAAFWYFLVLSGRTLSRRTAALLCVHPALLALVLLTNPWHEAFLRLDVVDGTVVDGVGPLFWVHSAYSYALLVPGIGLVLRAMTRAVPGHRHVYAVAVLGATVPSVGNVLTTVIATRSENLHLTPVFFLVSAAIWAWVERYRQHSRVVPVSTRQVLEALADAVVVLDPGGRLLDVNAAARVLLRRPDGTPLDDRAIGAPWREHLGPELGEVIAAGGSRVLTTASGDVLDVRVTRMADHGDRAVGTVVVLRDVTELERLRAELAHQATRDGLTGLHNRRAFEQRLGEAVAHARSTGAPLSLVLLDLDHFKAVNDTHGHAVGDRVLVAVADALAAAASDGETVARIGGEEFVLLLPGLTAPEASRRADEARARCAGAAVAVPGGDVRVTISAGAAELSSDGTADGVLRAADVAMYEAKAAGRDRVVTAPERGVRRRAVRR
ncbi:diguanylate cyclase domain-containing protein [Cellulomonas cellasea]|uniref:Diguanylate cyclase (GGDEF)-like protein n=1 Tax=Cellulomonas cellasea TaxID=43670 RepID=A0A7W4YBP3_9CELL|nr:diguanylate cyclase [Cellulomonas cellasea]MBB2923274.1 diguanylate cyclase (GGDEF)-like protein [Cellulomonas cellasea]